MRTIYAEPAERAEETLQLVQSAVEHEIATLEIALEAARKRLAPFEQKYGVTSAYFITNMVAEDLEGNDREYVRWAGEYRIVERLQHKLDQLQEIRYGKPQLRPANSSTS